MVKFSIKKQVEFNRYTTEPWLIYNKIIERSNLNSIEHLIVPIIDFSNLNMICSRSIIRIKKSCFTNIKTSYLVELNLEYNKIRKIDDFTFENLKSLKRLYLNDNELKRIFPKIFHGLKSLDELDLKSNKIKTIEDHSFQNLENLTVLS